MATAILTREQLGKTQPVKCVRQFVLKYDGIISLLCGGPGWYHVKSKTYITFPHYNRDEEIKRGPYRDLEHFLAESTDEDRTISGEPEALAELLAAIDTLEP